MSKSMHLVLSGEKWEGGRVQGLGEVEGASGVLSRRSLLVKLWPILKDSLGFSPHPH